MIPSAMDRAISSARERSTMAVALGLETNHVLELFVMGSSAANFFLPRGRRNPLKSPDSNEGIQGNPRKTKEKNPWIYLDLFGLAWKSLEKLGQKILKS
jgi:hypothetical protein